MTRVQYSIFFLIGCKSVTPYLLTNPAVNLTSGLDSSTTILSVLKTKEFRTGHGSGRRASVKWRRCRGIENMCTCSWSNSDPNLLLLDPEIKRTLRRARQVRRRIEFENNLRSQTENLASVNNSSYSSDSDSDCDIDADFQQPYYLGKYTESYQ
ncbi:hypothetical protein PIB30_098062, partial [Stylosanthes scabra]|nr:hypothetical protein [Stylosanthes scabra]